MSAEEILDSVIDHLIESGVYKNREAVKKSLQYVLLLGAMELYGKQEYNLAVTDCIKYIYPLPGNSEIDRVHSNRIKSSLEKLIKP